MAPSADPPKQAEGRWSGRPLLGGLITAAVFIVPIVVSVATAAALSRLLPGPSGLGQKVLWWSFILSASTVVLAAADRVTRRFLPLAALLKMSMVFPGLPPSRLAVARRAGSTRDLERRIADTRKHGLVGEPSEVAEQILSLSAALSVHDRRTRGHSERVRVLTDLLGEQLKLSPEARDRLRWSALLHDIGKLAVHPHILNKAGKPTAEEWEILRSHPLEGAKLAAPMVPWLGEWALAIEQHHEQYDGSGYPYGLAGEGISWGARIVSVADVFEVMTARRSYKDAVSPKRALAELTRCSGTQFDPAVVRSFLTISSSRLRWTMGPTSWVGQLPFIGANATGALAAVAGTAAGVATLTAAGVLQAPSAPRAQPKPAAVSATQGEPGGSTGQGSDGSSGSASSDPSTRNGGPSGSPDSATSSTTSTTSPTDPSVPVTVPTTVTVPPDLTTVPTVTLPGGLTIPPDLTTLPSLPTTVTTLPITVPTLPALPAVPVIRDAPPEQP